jgi:LEA14-like dessication related protein
MIYRYSVRFPLWGAVLWALLLSCRAAPVPVLPLEGPWEFSGATPEPWGELQFDRAEVGEGGRISLVFLAGVENPRSAGARLGLADWRLVIDGQEVLGAAVVPEGARVEAGAAGEIPLGLTLTIAEFLSKSGENAEFPAELTADLAFFFDNGETTVLSLSAGAVFPLIRKPEFSITGIEIMKAELINTRLKVDLRIDNPNLFPLTLSEFSYELYGQGRLWAEGEDAEILLISPESSAEKELRLVMNFINMDRNLLERIIALGQVPYRFTGEVEAVTGLDFLPRFRTAFDRSGEAAVVD